MRLPRQRGDRGRMDVKMTPMIDVVFQLLIFFVCTASFQAAEEILPAHLAPPAAGGTPAQIPPELAELEDVIIKVTHQQGQVVWQINGQSYDRLAQVHEVLRQLAEIRRDLPVILDIDALVPIGEAIDVFDLCRLVGFEKIQFAAKADS